MTRYRTGAHWGVTIVREGPGPEDVMGHRSGDELVAVVVGGDEGLAERICADLNTTQPTCLACHPALTRYLADGRLVLVGDARHCQDEAAEALPADEHHYDVSCDDRPDCTIPQHHALEDMP